MDSAYVYIITNSKNTVLYTGSTGSIKKRVYHHKNKLIAGFTKKYNVEKLVYLEICKDRNEALKRESQIKKGSRQRKILLLEKSNPSWTDLYYQLE